jgi:hypothetical protein
MLVASRQGRDMPGLARVMLLAGIGVTIAANVACGLGESDDPAGTRRELTTGFRSLPAKVW